jgi:hypothetical protein
MEDAVIFLRRKAVLGDDLGGDGSHARALAGERLFRQSGRAQGSEVSEVSIIASFRGLSLSGQGGATVRRSRKPDRILTLQASASTWNRCAHDVVRRGWRAKKARGYRDCLCSKD